MHVLHPSLIVKAGSKWASSDKLNSDDFEQSNHTVCSNRGTNLSAYNFEDEDISLRTNSVEHGLKLVLEGRCDAFLTLEEVAANTIFRSDDQNQKSNLVIVPADTGTTFDLHLMISKAAPNPEKLLSSINRELMKLEKSGRITELWAKYR